MEIMDVSFISLLVSLIISVFFSVYFLLPLLRSRKDKVQSPPGRIGLQFIGEMRDFISAGLKATPGSFILDRVKKYSSTTVKTSLFGEPMAILCGPEANKFIFSNENKLLRNWWPRGMNTLLGAPDDSDHGNEVDIRNIRKIFTYLTVDTLQKYVPTVDYETKQHLQTHWEGKDVITVHPLVKLQALTITCKLILGVGDEATMVKLNKLIDQLNAAVLSFPVNIPGTTFSRSLKARAELQNYFKELINKFKTDSKEGRSFASGSILAELVRDSPEEDGVPDRLMAVISSGHNITSDTLTSALMFMAKHPHVYDKVLAEQREIARSKGPGEPLIWTDLRKMKYSWNVASEVLRLNPPRVIFREVMSDFTFDRFFIPKGWKIVFSPYYTHKNPEYFEDPEKFDPSRFEGEGAAPFTYIPFGGGPRMCPGKELSRIQILVFMHYVVTKFKWEQIYPDEKMKLSHLLIPEKGLPIRLHPYK